MGSSPEQLVSILSASIAPVIVISGIGLLLLSMTNRYSRVIDLARDLVRELDSAHETPRHTSLAGQLRIIYKRARLLRISIVLSSLGILFVVVTILSLFFELVLGVRVDLVSVPSFAMSLLALLGSLYFFIRDVGMSLDALKLQIGSHLREP